MAKRKKKSSAAGIIALLVLAAGIIILLIVLLCMHGSSDLDSEDPSASQNVAADSSESATDSSDTSDIEAEITTEPAVSYDPDEDEWAWALYVIGNDNPLPDDFTVTTKTVIGERVLDERCADYAIAMLEAAEAEGVGLYVTSAYRSVATQASNLQSYIDSLISSGYSEEEAAAQASIEIAMPGCSEHNAGLAMDIVSDDYWSNHSDLDESFELLPQYEWLIENAWKYGFILSYPKGKEDITGFIYEPWHFRFVGLTHAEKIHEIYEETGEFLTVNEYIESYIQ